MGNRNHIDVIKRKRVSGWNKWRAENLKVQPDLTRINLSGRKLEGIDFRGVGLFKANLSHTNLRGAILRQSILINTNFEKADLTGAFVYGASVWDVNLSGAIQSDLVITPPNAPVITVDNLEVAQFVYLLLNNKKLRDVIKTITTKAVLILGRFTTDRKKILDSIKKELRQRNYLPILFDFDKPEDRDFTETISTLAHMSRFIIADITTPRVVLQELQAIVPTLEVTVQPLLDTSCDIASEVFLDFLKYPWVLKPFKYKGADDLFKSFDKKVIAPSEKKVKNLKSLKSARGTK